MRWARRGHGLQPLVVGGTKRGTRGPTRYLLDAGSSRLLGFCPEGSWLDAGPTLRTRGHLEGKQVGREEVQKCKSEKRPCLGLVKFRTPRASANTGAWRPRA